MMNVLLSLSIEYNIIFCYGTDYDINVGDDGMRYGGCGFR